MSAALFDAVDALVTRYDIRGRNDSGRYVRAQDVVTDLRAALVDQAGALAKHDAEVLRAVEEALAPVDETWGGAAMVVRDRVRVALSPNRPKTNDHAESKAEFMARTSRVDRIAGDQP